MNDGCLSLAARRREWRRAVAETRARKPPPLSAWFGLTLSSAARSVTRLKTVGALDSVPGAKDIEKAMSEAFWCFSRDEGVTVTKLTPALVCSGM